MKKTYLKEIIREIVKTQLSEKAKWRTSSAAQQIGDPFNARGDELGYAPGEMDTYLKAKSDTDLPSGALQNRMPAQMATRGPRTGKPTMASLQRTKGRIQQYAQDVEHSAMSNSPAPQQVKQAASKEAGGKVVFGRYFDATGKYLGRVSGGKWVDAAQDTTAPTLENLLKLKEIIREMINEELSAMDETSQAAKDAKVQGLTNMGFGRWGKDGKVTHISVNGKLEKFSKAAMQRKTGMTFGRGKNANTMYNQWGGAKATMTEPGKVQRATPVRTPDQQRVDNKPMDSLGDYRGTIQSKIVSKLSDKIWDTAGEELSNHYNTDMSIDDLSKLTGLNTKQIKVYDKYADDYDRAFSINPDGKSAYIHDPADL